MSLLQQSKNIYRLSKGLKNYFQADEESKKNLAAQYLSHLMAEEKGLFLKIGQFLGTSDSSMEEFKSLTKGKVKALPFKIIETLLTEHFSHLGLGTNLYDIFASIEPLGHPASIGQVHKAQLKNGEIVALKIQYPEIEGEIKSLMKVFQLIPGVGPAKKWGFNITEYKEMLKNNFEQELSYKQEGKNQLSFYSHFKDSTQIQIPKAYPELSSKTLLVSQWAPGRYLSDIIGLLSAQEKIDLGQRLIGNFFQQLFVYGLIQADSNEGNYLFDKQQNQINIHLIDFGSCLEVPKATRLLLLKMIFSFIQKNADDPIDYLVAIGFDQNKLLPLHGGLPLLLEKVFEPFKHNRPFDLKTWQISKVADLAFGDNKWLFRAAGPTYFFLLMRAFTGVIDLLKQLDMNLNYQKILYQNTSSLISQLIHIHPQKVCKNSIGFNSIANNIYLQVLDNEEEKISMSLPTSALMQLESFIDEPVLESIRAKGLNIKNICEHAIAQGAKPQSLFEHKYGSKLIKVWLQ